VRPGRSAVTLTASGDPAAFVRRPEMAWKKPTIVEVPVSMEINMYACATRK
jgi:coenzyme PQQ precursor peptide PqqA